MTEKIVIIDYGSGNLRSASKALEHVVDKFSVSKAVVVTNDPDVVIKADRILLPGVGAFEDCKNGLVALDGMIDALTEAIKKRGRPFLGVCVGMQLLAEEGQENGSHVGLGWIPGRVIGLKTHDKSLKVPHMGWNELKVVSTHPILNGIPNDGHVYFVHSYQMQCTDLKNIIAKTDYGSEISAVVGLDNIVGTQFHPEKSQKNGLHILHNFIHWYP